MPSRDITARECRDVTTEGVLAPVDDFLLEPCGRLLACANATERRHHAFICVDRGDRIEIIDRNRA